MIFKKLVVSSSLLLMLGSSVVNVEAETNNDTATSSIETKDENSNQSSTVALMNQPQAAPSTTYYFKDVNKTYWAANSIMNLVNKGYMKGYQDGTFKPNSATTRGEAAAVIAKSLGISLESEFDLNAKDVPTTHPYYDEIRKLVELGVIQNSELIRPNEPLQRCHISKMISLAYDIIVDKKNNTSFKDYDKTFWAKYYIESLADAGVISGTTKTRFSPNQNVTRAQLAVMVERALEFKRKVNNHEVAYDYLEKNYISTFNSYKKWTEEVIALVNNERKTEGIELLTQDPSLNQLAIIKAQDMIKRKYFEHESPYYGNPWDMATLFDYEYSSYGENIARNISSPKEVVKAWMASPKHRENILKGSYTNIGIGIKTDSNGNYYWVQLFSSK